MCLIKVNVFDKKVTESHFFELLARMVLIDISVDCFKLGVLGSVAAIEVLYSILKTIHTRMSYLDLSYLLEECFDSRQTKQLTH